MNPKFLVAVFISFLFFSCSKDDTSDSGQYSKGVFVVNQGVFQSGTGTITFHNYKDTIKNVFEKENPGQVLGNIAQSMIAHDNKYFIAVNNANKIAVCDGTTFKSQGEIKGISLPRYFAASSTKLYVSAWGADFKSGNVYEINPKTLSITATIKTGGAPESMLISGDKLYVTISTVTEKSKSIAIIDIKTNTITQRLDISDNPTHIVSDKNGAIWVLCGGNSDWANPALSTDGALVRLVNDKVEKSFKLNNGVNGLAIDKNKDRLFFLMAGKVFAHDITDQTFEKESVYDGSFYAIGYHHTKGRLYLADAGNFQSDGTVTHIDPITKATGRYTAGIIPGFFYFAE
jgi:DNA-binding beta-propeller fold protein YncE